MRFTDICLILLAPLLLSSCSAPASSAGANSPTEAYKSLYAAVKSKNTEAIKGNMTKKTQDFAEMVADRNKAPIEKVFENGFSETTFAETLPEIRDERVNGNMGAVEVWNATSNVWEDLPFILEDGSWKLAVGEMWANTYQSPGKGRAQKEREAANAARGDVPPTNVNSNTGPPANVLKQRDRNAKKSIGTN
jgi:hypothetical protein